MRLLGCSQQNLDCGKFYRFLQQINYKGKPKQEGKTYGLKETKQDFLVAQWLRICLPMQGTRVQSLVQEDPTCHGATEPVRHNY